MAPKDHIYVWIKNNPHLRNWSDVEWGLDHIGHQENVHVYKQQYFYCLIIIYKDYKVYVLYDTVWDPGD